MPKCLYLYEDGRVDEKNYNLTFDKIEIDNLLFDTCFTFKDKDGNTYSLNKSPRISGYINDMANEIIYCQDRENDMMIVGPAILIKNNHQNVHLSDYKILTQC